SSGRQTGVDPTTHASSAARHGGGRVLRRRPSRSRDHGNRRPPDEAAFIYEASARKEAASARPVGRSSSRMIKADDSQGNLRGNTEHGYPTRRMTYQRVDVS